MFLEKEQKSIGKKAIRNIMSRIKGIKVKYVVIIGILMLVVLGSYYGKGLFVVALVDGSPISRLGVVRILEKESGKRALDYLVIQKLIASEARAKNVHVADDEIKSEIKKIETELSAQGQTLAAVLATQGMQESDLNSQIVMQKTLEKLVADTVSLSDEEVASYIKDNKITFPAGADIRAEREKVKEFLLGQKRNQEMQAMGQRLRDRARIRYFVTY